MIFALILFAIAALQGAAVFATAFLAWRKLQLSHSAWKVLLMAGSYLGWAGVTLLGFTLLGAGGLMDGLIVALFLLGTCALSSAIYLLAWLVGPVMLAADQR